MKNPSRPMHETTNSPSGREESTTRSSSRTTRIASLLSVAVTVGATVMLAAMSGPKLPKGSGE